MLEVPDFGKDKWNVGSEFVGMLFGDKTNRWNLKIFKGGCGKRAHRTPFWNLISLIPCNHLRV